LEIKIVGLHGLIDDGGKDGTGKYSGDLIKISFMDARETIVEIPISWHSHNAWSSDVISPGMLCKKSCPDI